MRVELSSGGRCIRKFGPAQPFTLHHGFSKVSQALARAVNGGRRAKQLRRNGVKHVAADQHLQCRADDRKCQLVQIIVNRFDFQVSAQHRNQRVRTGPERR